MDLYAYAQINNLQELAELNGINVPRLRGYRLMRDEEPVSEDFIQDIVREQAIEEATYLCVSDWEHSRCREYSKRTDAIRKHYLTYVLEETMFAGQKVDDYFDRSYCDIYAKLTILPKAEGEHDG